jgi:hypothetical protein
MERDPAGLSTAENGYKEAQDKTVRRLFDLGRDCGVELSLFIPAWLDEVRIALMENSIQSEA